MIRKVISNPRPAVQFLLQPHISPAGAYCITSIRTLLPEMDFFWHNPCLLLIGFSINQLSNLLLMSWQKESGTIDRILLFYNIKITQTAEH